MTSTNVVRSGEECDADQEYYKCSHFDFEFDGCCSHDPCIKPRGCRDNSVFIDTSLLPLFSTIDMPNTETATSESTATESATESTFTTDRFARETTLVTRRRLAPTSMDEGSEETEISSPQRHTAPSKTMTDSGTTRTIPNPNRVTVTRVTLVPTSKLPPTSVEGEPLAPGTVTATDVFTYSTASFETSPTGFATETSTPIPSVEYSHSGSPPIGLIVGAVVGGVVALVLVVLAVMMIRRRKHNRELWVNGAGQYCYEEKEEKSYLKRMLSRNTTQRSQDPFAPFGGRIDRVDNPQRPPSGTFEMDGTSTVPVELPAVIFSDAKVKESRPVGHMNATSAEHPAPAGYVAPTRYPTANGSSADPRANLNASLEDRQQKQFVNHWNQYRALGEGAPQN
ncbi:hypothetical protein FGRMN_2874 [Fusarium graminum]|nr:hypothetical protein FGRMN_2874 [Fusarium graminum]